MKYIIGVQKLDEANTNIEQMKITLDDLKPILEEKSKECEIMLTQLDKEQVEVEEVTKIVEQ